jgi:hypothetical protein
MPKCPACGDIVVERTPVIVKETGEKEITCGRDECIKLTRLNFRRDLMPKPKKVGKLTWKRNSYGWLVTTAHGRQGIVTKSLDGFWEFIVRRASNGETFDEGEAYTMTQAKQYVRRGIKASLKP